MAVSPVARRGSALAIGVIVATIGLVMSVAFLALTVPPDAHDASRFALVAIVATTGSIGAFLIWRAPRKRVAWIRTLGAGHASTATFCWQCLLLPPETESRAHGTCGSRAAGTALRRARRT